MPPTTATPRLSQSSTRPERIPAVMVTTDMLIVVRRRKKRIRVMVAAPKRKDSRSKFLISPNRWTSIAGARPLALLPPHSCGKSPRTTIQAMPLTQPPSTGSEINLAYPPPRRSQNRNSQRAVKSVNTGMTATASALPWAIPRLGSSVPTRAAGAASTPKINRGEPVIRPKTSTVSSDP